MKNTLWTFFFLLFQVAVAQENIPIETWRTHNSYRTVFQIADAGNIVYAATKNGIFYFDKEERSIDKITKMDGLSEVGLSAIGWQPQKKILVVGYESGNIDLVNEKGNIINIPTIRNSTLRGSKSYTDIDFFGNNAYLSSPQGITVVNLEKKVVIENYFHLGLQGRELGVTNIIVFQDSLFITSSEGIMAGPLTGNHNLMDFNRWKRYNINNQNENLTSLVHYNDKLVAIDNQGKLHIYSNYTWSLLEINFTSKVKKICTSNNRLFVVLEKSIVEITDLSVQTEIGNNLIMAPADVLADSNNTLWIADLLNGVVTNIDQNFASYFPDGPFINNFKKIYALGNGKVYAIAGSDQTAPAMVQESGFSVFEKGTWINFNRTGAANSIPTPGIKNINDVLYDPYRQVVWFATMSSGLLGYFGENNFQLYDENSAGTTLLSPFPGQTAAVSALAQHYDENLWFINFDTPLPLQYFDINNGWHKTNIQESTASYAKQLLISDLNDKWLIIDPAFGGRIIVYNVENQQLRYISSQPDQGNLPSNNVTAVAFDRDQQVWIGTEKGIAVLPSINIIETQQLSSYIPIYNFRELFRNQPINSIAVDQGNRKWIGTDNGAWLFGQAGDTLIYHFTTSNSPLPSNKIYDIAVDNNSGEVFLATEKGIASFRSTATQATTIHQKLNIFPNPVTSGFAGKVGISGLADGAIVKITDITGKLIRQTVAEGGTATWDVADYNGKRAATGVYLIYSASVNGEETYVGKIAVVK